MSLHIRTFDYLVPTPAQITVMAEARLAVQVYANHLDAILPEGPDKTYVMRCVRETAMWVNVAISRQPDGGPR